MKFSVTKLDTSKWHILRELRFAALEDSPEWFAGDLEEESARGEKEWLKVLERDRWFALMDDSRAIGLMAISDRDSDRGTDCWLFSCWIDPSCRRQGLLHLLMDRFDDECRTNGWKVQGLGVWPNNLIAIEAYQQLGFEKVGEPKPSRIRPGQFYQMMQRTLPAE